MSKSHIFFPQTDSITTFIIIILTYCTIICSAYDGQTNAWSQPLCGKPIKLAFYEYGYLYFDGKGIDRDIVEELRKRSGCSFEFQVMARARIWADLASGDLDMSVSGIQNPERDKFAIFAPYMAIKNYAVVNSSVAARAGTGDDFISLNNLQMGAVTSFKHGKKQDELLDRLRRAGRVQESPDAESIFLKLKTHRVDGMFSQPPVFRKYLSDLEMEDMVSVLDWAPDEKGVPHGLIMSRHRFNEEEAEKWRNLILDMKKDGTLKRIYMKYLPEKEAEQILDM